MESEHGHGSWEPVGARCLDGGCDFQGTRSEEDGLREGTEGYGASGGMCRFSTGFTRRLPTVDSFLPGYYTVSSN